MTNRIGTRATSDGTARALHYQMDQLSFDRVQHGMEYLLGRQLVHRRLSEFEKASTGEVYTGGYQWALARQVLVADTDYERALHPRPRLYDRTLARVRHFPRPQPRRQG